jgi:hypothetical protein
MGIDTQAISAIEALTRLAEQFGPFLFALLFIMFVTRTARGYYAECMARTAPPPTEQETKTYRFYFMSSFVIGVFVMALSIGWWFYRQAKGNYVYQVSIVNLEPKENVVSEYYSRNNIRQTFPGALPHHDALFLIVRDQPYQIGETLSFQYIKQSNDQNVIGSGLSPTLVEVKYVGGTALSYKMVSDSSGPRLVLTAQNEPSDGAFTAEEIDFARHYASARTRQASP